MILQNITHHANIVTDKTLFDNVVLELKDNNNEVFDYLYNEDEDGGKNLSIDEVREFNKIINTQTTKKRYIIISKKIANTNTQNSLLKILEEAKSNICFIFFIENISVLLPTILSRVNFLQNKDLILPDTILTLSDKALSVKDLSYNSFNIRLVKDSNFLNSNITEIYITKVEKLIKNKKYKDIENLICFKDFYNKGAIPEKNFVDYLNLL